jgi:hypothetical protein
MTTLPQDRASRHKLQGFCTTTVPTNILQWTSNLENPRKTGVYGRALAVIGVAGGHTYFREIATLVDDMNIFLRVA